MMAVAQLENDGNQKEDPLEGLLSIQALEN